MVDKVIDLEKVDFDDPRWWLHFEAIRDELLHRDRIQHVRDQLFFRSISMCIPNLKSELFEDNAEQTIALSQRLRQLIFRLKETEGNTESTDEELLGLQTEWEAVFGKLSDPETQARIQRTKELLEKMGESELSNPEVSEYQKRLIARRKAKEAEQAKSARARMAFRPGDRNS